MKFYDIYKNNNSEIPILKHDIITSRTSSDEQNY